MAKIIVFKIIINIILWLSFLKIITKNLVSLFFTRFGTTKQSLTNQANILNKNTTESFIEISKGVGGLL